MLIFGRPIFFRFRTVTILPRFMSSNTPLRPVEAAIRQKLSALLNPIVFEISNDSSQHRHHQAMREQNAGPETHFSLNIVSDSFQGKTLLQRHRMVQKVLSDEFSSGLHALSLKTTTPEELSKS